jgi:anthranilate phosphoribosyltransferase
VHGEDGLDEITLTGRTFVAEASEGKVTTFAVNPSDFGLSVGALDHLRGGDADANALIIRDVLSGNRRDEARDLVVMNAAAALLIGGKAGSLGDAARIAEESVDGGAAQGKLEALIEATRAE